MPKADFSPISRLAFRKPFEFYFGFFRDAFEFYFVFFEMPSSFILVSFEFYFGFVEMLSSFILFFSRCFRVLLLDPLENLTFNFDFIFGRVSEFCFGSKILASLIEHLLRMLANSYINIYMHISKYLYIYIYVYMYIYACTCHGLLCDL